MLTAKEMIITLSAALSSNPGVAEVNIDGQKVRYDRAQLIAELKYWKSEAAKENGRRPLFKGFNLDSAF